MTQAGGNMAAGFIPRLLALGDERGGHAEPRRRAALAELRRGLGKAPGEAPAAYSETLTLIGDAAIGQPLEDIYFQVATLYALYPHNTGTPRDIEPWRRRNIGGSLALLGGKEERRKGAERRLLALLNCPADDLPDHLRHAVSLLRADDRSIDWQQLLADLRNWDREDRRVQRSWARSFWGHSAEAASDNATTTTNTTNDAGQTVAGQES